MTLKNKSIVVLLSGGLDSSTVTGIAKKSEARIFGLSFDYGQRHKKELNSASIIAKHFDIEEFKIIKLDLSIWGGSSLTDTQKNIPIEEYKLIKFLILMFLGEILYLFPLH